VEGDGVANLCTWDLCEIVDLASFLAAPPRLIWRARSRYLVQVGYRCMRTIISLGLLGLRVSILFLGCSR
jgi:hypothetical protein